MTTSTAPVNLTGTYRVNGDFSINGVTRPDSSTSTTPDPPSTPTTTSASASKARPRSTARTGA